MTSADRVAQPIAASRANLLARLELLDAGLTDRQIVTRLRTGRWVAPHPGVYLAAAAPLDWRGRLLAAVLAAGPQALASHRAAVVLWGLDGVGNAPVEITVPITHGPVPAGVIVHRTRRPPPPSIVDGIPVTSLERTVLDAAGCLPPVVVEKAMESALRRNLTSAARIERFVGEHGGRGVRGTRALRELLAWRVDGEAARSGAEAELLHRLRLAGVANPVRQHPVRLPDGTVATVDLAWPPKRKAIEVDGLDAHATAQALEHDDERQNQLLEAGWELRRYGARRLRREPERVVASVLRFLGL